MSAKLGSAISAAPKKTILVVDDEADIQELLRYNLEQEGYHVVVLDNGEKAREYVKKGSADLILLDLMLPGVPGLELCKELKKQPELESIPIIMITAKSSETDV